jgi:glycosyltransferase involved in cell wall biosynthesis
MSKVAIVGQIEGKGGAERVILEMAKVFDADIYSIPYEKSFEEFKDFSIYSKKLLVEKLPLPRFLRIFATDMGKKLGYLRLDLSGYDLVIAAKPSGLFATIDIENPCVYYCHGPPNYIYQHKRYYARRFGIPFRIWSGFWIEIFKNLSDFPDKWIVNSKTTQSVVKEFYGKDSTVVYPPVNVERLVEGESEDYFLSVQNLSGYKRVDWQVQVFNQLNEKLKIVGTGPEKEKLEKMAKENIEFLGSVSDSELVELYSHCKAVIQTNLHEDFGIVPVEAMASGKPAICPNRAGFRETVIDGETGILFDEPFVSNMKKCIMEFDPSKFDPKKCRKRAEKFNRKRFREKIKEVVKVGTS